MAAMAARSKSGLGQGPAPSPPPSAPAFHANDKVLKQHYFTPSEGLVPIAQMHAATAESNRHVPVSINPQTGSIDMTNAAVQIPTPLRTLDGFTLLSASGVGFPDDSLQANIVGGGYGYAVEEDFRFFTNLEYIDASENQLGLNNFNTLPNLKELRLVCNNISRIDEVIGFERLFVLDLSYNKISSRSFQNLAFIPNLMELDVSGNSLKALPYDMSKFSNLMRLIAENNKFDDNYSFEKLATIPRLVHCDLAYNYLSKFPSKAADEGCYKNLTSFDISFNYFAAEDDVMPMTKLSKISKLYLYGNPLLGPTGEDPMQMYVEDLVNNSLDYRQGKGLNVLQIVTDIPKKRQLKKGKALGRLSHYQNFEVTAVETVPDKKSREWRDEGSALLQADLAKALAAHNPPGRPTTAQNANPIPDMTFMTAGLDINGENDNWAFNVADNVMSKVAEEMGLGSSHDLDILEQQAALKTIFNTQNQRSIEAIPDGLFSQKMGEMRALIDPTMSVKVAINALKFAIEHPLSDYGAIPKAGANKYGIGRPTILSHSRKTSKLVAKEIIDPELIVKPQGERQTMFGTSKRAPKGAERTYAQIESVLDKLNNNTDELTTRPCGHGMNIKENLNVLKAFPRPNKVMKGLVDTVTGIVDQLD